MTQEEASAEASDAAPGPGRTRRAARCARDWVVAAAGMSGLRLDRLRGRHGAAWLVLWLAGFGASAAWSEGLLGSRPGVAPALVYAGAACALYYGGLFLVLGRGRSRLLVRRLGSERALRAWELGLGLAFAHQAFGAGAVCMADRGSLVAVPAWVTAPLGLACLVAGFGIKLWSARALGLDSYYYRDMFLRRGVAAGSFVPGGPYRWIENPMYGVGYLSAYGAALWYRSVAGLLVAVVAQAGIYAFYYSHELPFVRRTYRPVLGGPSPGAP